MFLELLLVQLMITNPRSVEFVCPDHGVDTAHEIDIINAQGAVIQTIQGGDPAPVGIENGLPLVRIDINVQPVAMGNYTVRVRAVAGAVQSADSEPSEVWQRVPGAPGKPRVGG